MKSMGKGAIQLRSGILRGMNLSLADNCNSQGLTAIPADAGKTALAGGAVRKGHWLERDLARAIAVASRSGIGSYRVEVSPDGTIAIVVGGERRTGPRKARPVARRKLPGL